MGLLIENINIVGAKYDFSNDLEISKSRKELNKICIFLNKEYEDSSYEEYVYFSFLEEEVFFNFGIEVRYWGSADMRSTYGYGIILSPTDENSNTFLSKLLKDINSIKLILEHHEISIC